MKIFLFLYLLSFSFNFLFEMYQPEEVINFLNKKIFPPEDAQNIKEKLIKVLEETYAFYEISKNPPQPDFDHTYHDKVDIKKEINKINVENRSFYNLYQDLLRALSKLKDGHVSIAFFDLHMILENFIIFLPLGLKINLDSNEKPVMNGYNRILNEEMRAYYKNNDTIFDIIENNQDSPIKYINGKNPFDYISKFGSDYKDFRSPHASFPSKFNSIEELFSLAELPLSLEELSNFTVVYENGNNFTTDLVVLSFYDIYEEDDENNELLLKNAKVDFDKKNIFSPENKGQKDKLNKILNKINIKKEGLKLLSDNETIEWNYNFSKKFKCRVDNENEVNVYFIKSFMEEKNITLFIDIIEKCGKLFDENNYPIIFITSLNGGGVGNISQFLLETISPFSTLNIYGAVRKTDAIVDYYLNLTGVEEEAELYSIDNCELVNLKKFSQNEFKVNYGEGVKDILTQQFIMHGKDFRERVDNFKLNLTNPRKPTDIILFTDGYSFSATSLFLKYLQYYGGGITVGYFGNPKEDKIKFDSSQSPSAILANDSLYNISDEYKELNDKYNFVMQLSAVHSFTDKKKVNIPLEFEVFPVDERVKYYEFYNNEKDLNYYEFIKIAKTLLNKYKTNCNPNNKKLLKLTNECDKTFKNKYTHGGYECGNDKKWSTKCVASYCDIGYIFDHEQNKCVADGCSKYKKEEKKEKTKAYVYVLISIGILVLLIVIVFAIICIKKRKEKNSIDYDSIPNNMNMDMIEKS